MRTLKKTALAAVLGAALVTMPSLAHAHGWGWGPFPRPFHHGRFFGPPVPLIGLGIAGAVLGTAAVVNSIVPRVYVAPPPPPPPYYPYDDAYQRGYDRGRRDAYDDAYRSHRYDD